MFKKFIIKICFLALVFCLSGIGFTRAEFIDDEKSTDNQFSALTLDFSLSSSSDFSPQPLIAGGTSLRNIILTNNGLIMPKYNIGTVVTNDNNYFCSNLNLEANLDGSPVYNGRLVDLNLLPLIIFGGTEDDWEFKLSLISNDAGYQNQTCGFNFVFRGWQIESDGTWGFTDEEILGNLVASGDWTISPTPTSPKVVINEVYYHGGSENEWVEVYNAGSSAVDLSNWTITDNNESDTLSAASLILSPDSFAVIVGGNNSGQSVAAGAILIVLGDTRIGGGLADSGDKLILKDNVGNIIDQMNYGNDIAVWNPARAGVAAGHSLARSPKGFDTDAPGDFVDLVVPNPGTNPHPPTPTSAAAIEPQVELWLSTDKTKVSFEVTEIKEFNKLSYEIIYDTIGEDKGIAGSVDLVGEETFSRENLVLGSCSSLGEVCTYDQGITKINLKVILDDDVKVLEKEIIY